VGFRGGVSTLHYRCFGAEYLMTGDWNVVHAHAYAHTHGPWPSLPAIADGDLETLAKFLGRGLGYPSQYFSQVLNRLAKHPTPTGFPSYGYVLEAEGKIVGAILLIFSTIWSDDAPRVRCHVTSWCVEPEYRSYATLFFSKALRYPGVSYINISARPATRPIIEAQGFLQYCQGHICRVSGMEFLVTIKQ
jgi:hypothetical protein